MLKISCYCKDENQVFFVNPPMICYYLLTQIIPFIYYSVTKRIFRNVKMESGLFDMSLKNLGFLKKT